MKKLFLLPVLVGMLMFSSPAVSRADEALLAEKMKTIEANQERILQALEEIKSELQIVKVRITSN